MSIVDDIRKRLNMEDPNDVKAWEELMEIQRTPIESLVKEFVKDMKLEMAELDKSIESFEKQRIRYLLTNPGLSKQAGEISIKLREERDELRKTLQSEAYQGVDGRPRSGTPQAGRRSGAAA